MILVYFGWRDYSTTSDGADTKSVFNILQTLPNTVQKREMKYHDSNTIKNAPPIMCNVKKNLLLSITADSAGDYQRTRFG